MSLNQRACIFSLLILIGPFAPVRASAKSVQCAGLFGPKVSAKLLDRLQAELPERVPLTVLETPKKNTSGDVPFSDFTYGKIEKFKITEKETHYAYASLPEAVARVNDFTFYGKSYGKANLRKIQDDIKKWFSEGQTKTAIDYHQPHNSLSHHILNRPLNGAFSDFVSSTLDFSTAMHFASMNQPQFKVIFIFDLAGAEVLNVDASISQITQTETLYGESEVLLTKNLSPDRIVGALIYKGDSPVASELVLNRNYRFLAE
jgi:hypothetical protein